MNKWMTRVIAGLGAMSLGAVVLGGGVFGWPSPASAAVPSRAPEFTGIDHWINSPPLTIRELRGKVVLIDFWTYSCINCLRTFPYVTHWYDKYKKDGLVVIGVHSPEFDFEKSTANVKQAVKHFHINYPVAQDNEMATWNAWHNQFWPAEYLVDKQGNVVLHHFGEGHYEEMEAAIRKQLGLPPATDDAVKNSTDFSGIGSPEMYFGSNRLQNLVEPESPTASSHDYQAPDTLPLNRFALDGRWKITPEFAQFLGQNGEIRLHFKAGKLHMVANSDKPVTLSVTVDGKSQPPVTVHMSQLYTLFDSHDYHDHVVTIKIPKAGLRAFTFTFG